MSLINCNQPNLQRRLAEYEDLRKNFVTVKLIHAKREFNQAADFLTSKTLVLGESWELNDLDETVHLRLVSRIPENIMNPSEISGTPVTDAAEYTHSGETSQQAVGTQVGSPRDFTC
ncbi:hypothetical protein PHMEG_00037320 [Phytophthora megakarya]|uniref:RNase H type-1 domain-containing protein n=1 Tax=Phytophthora megakarya TaxID=4795 RepID=A0A225UJY3_9STRA|nr:hypothetical protein PHMEG_00037320 [Phytophthora megakarya]